MSRREIIRERKSALEVRKAFEFYYTNKFFNQWMKKFKIQGMDYQESYYMMKKFWFEGTIACSRRVGIELVKDRISPFVLTPWVMNEKYNCYDFPVKAMCINVRGVDYISNEPLEVDKEIVLLWCMPNHKGVFSLINPKLKQLVDIEMVIRICTNNQKSPWVIAMSPEDKKAVNKFIEDMDSDEPILVTMLNDLKNAKSLASAAPYVVDKLEAMRQKIEDDIKTLIGVTNVGIAQKKEHFTDDEVQANNQEIEDNSEDFLDEVKQGLERCNKVFGFNFSIELANPVLYNEGEDKEVQEDE